MARAAATLAPPGEGRARHPVLFGLWVGLVIVIALAMILFLVLPTRTWLSQRSSMSDTSRRLAVLTEENEALAGRVAALQEPAEVERVARQQYGMIRPGEKAISVLPAAPLQQLPTTWPYSIVDAILKARGVPAPTPSAG